MGNHEIVELLIHNGADVDALDQNKYNALHYAIMENHVMTVAILLSYHASLIVKNGQGENPIEYALKKKSLESLKTCLGHKH